MRSKKKNKGNNNTNNPTTVQEVRARMQSVF